MKKGIWLILAGTLWFQGVSAATLKVKNHFGSGIFKEVNLKSRGKLTEAELELSEKYRCFGVRGALASLLTPTLLSSVNERLKGNLGISTKDRFGLRWGKVWIEPTEDLVIEAGVLTTMVGQELPPHNGEQQPPLRPFVERSTFHLQRDKSFNSAGRLPCLRRG